MEDGLRRDAGVVQAAPSGLVLLDDGCLLPELPGAYGGDVTARAASDHDHVVVSHRADSIGGFWPASASAPNGLCSRAPSHQPLRRTHQARPQAAASITAAWGRLASGSAPTRVSSNTRE